MSTIRRNRTLDFMRLAFALAVILGHAVLITDGVPDREILFRLSGGKLMTHGLAVDGFFILSGYLIVRSWQYSDSAWSYFQKRFLRIVPGFVVAFVLSAFVVGLLAPAIPDFFPKLFHYMPIKRLVVSLCLLDSPMTPPVFPGLAFRDPNGSLWTISYEVKCYVLVAVLGSLRLLRRPWVLLALTIVCFGWFLVSPENTPLRFGFLGFLVGRSGDVLRLAGCFGLGGCFLMFQKHIPFRRSMMIVAAVGMLASVYLLAKPEVAVIVFGAYLLFYLAKQRIPYPDWAQQMPDVSYGVYLYGWPVESLWIWYFHGSPWITFIACSAICLVIGWLSWTFVERPMLAMKSGKSVELPAGLAIPV